MYKLIVTGARRAVLAIHRVQSLADVRELVAVYEAMGHKPEALLVEEERQDQAA